MRLSDCRTPQEVLDWREIKLMGLHSPKRIDKINDKATDKLAKLLGVSLPDAESEDKWFYRDSEGNTIPVDRTAHPWDEPDDDTEERGPLMLNEMSYAALRRPVRNSKTSCGEQYSLVDGARARNRKVYKATAVCPSRMASLGVFDSPQLGDIAPHEVVRFTPPPIPPSLAGQGWPGLIPATELDPHGKRYPMVADGAELDAAAARIAAVELERAAAERDYAAAHSSIFAVMSAPSFISTGRPTRCLAFLPGTPGTLVLNA